LKRTIVQRGHEIESEACQQRRGARETEHGEVYSQALIRQEHAGSGRREGRRSPDRERTADRCQQETLGEELAHESARVLHRAPRAL
jgi:hypothetical protein